MCPMKTTLTTKRQLLRAFSWSGEVCTLLRLVQGRHLKRNLLGGFEVRGHETMLCDLRIMRDRRCVVDAGRLEMFDSLGAALVRLVGATLECKEEYAKQWIAERS
jgi:hypothetical protein